MRQPADDVVSEGKATGGATLARRSAVADMAIGEHARAAGGYPA
jgi:hypothetical protein